MKNRITVIAMIILLISSLGICLLGCVDEEVDPFEHVYGTYEISGWSYKTEYSVESFMTDLNNRRNLNNEDYEEFQEIRDILGSEITIIKGNIQLSGDKTLENIPYSGLRKSGIEGVYFTTDTRIKPNTGLEIDYDRDIIKKPVEHYVNSLIIRYRQGGSEDFLELKIYYGRLSNKCS